MWSLSPVLAIALLIASHVSCGLITDIHRDNGIDSIAKHFVDALVHKRQTTTSTDEAIPFNATNWDIQTNAACVNTLRALNGVASNSAGLALCYNVVSLDSTNGSFYADMRIYTVASPTGDFANVPAQNVMVAAKFNGATVQTISAASLQKREEYGLESWPSIRRGIVKRASIPALVQSYRLFGKANMTGMSESTDVMAMEALLTPTVSLTAQTTSVPTRSVNATLSTTEASFIAGVLLSTNSAASGAIDPSTTTNMTGIAAVVVPAGELFRMPGTKILIFPVGAIITGTWAVALVGTIAYGTYGRMAFREQFRRRKAREAGRFYKGTGKMW